MALGSELCGCGRHELQISDKDVVLWGNDWWKIRCLTMKVDRRLPVVIKKIVALTSILSRIKTKFVHMKRLIRKMPCNNCGYPVGNRFKVVDDEVFCGACKTVLNQPAYSES